MHNMMARVKWKRFEAIAHQDLSELKYLGNEQVFSCEKAMMKLQSCFHILDKEFTLKSLKVHAMFDHIHMSHPTLVAMIPMVKG